MWEWLKDWAARMFGFKPPKEERTQGANLPPDQYTARYEDIGAENITATIAGKLAMLAFADSSMSVTAADGSGPSAGSDGLTPRTRLIAEHLERLWKRDAVWITAQMLGKGGKVLVPTVSRVTAGRATAGRATAGRGEITISVIDQSRMLIRAMDNRCITSATLLADAVTVDESTQSAVTCFLMADYERSGTAQRIRYRVRDENGASRELTSIPQWADITEEITIDNTDRLLFAFLRCPRDNRTDERRYGVPITYGAEKDIEELSEHAAIYRREFKLTRPMLGLDSSLWRQGGTSDDGWPGDGWPGDGWPGGGAMPMNIDVVRKTVQDGDDPFIPWETASLEGKSAWQYFAPAIRQEAMEARYQSLCRRVEKALGLSQGVLTERQSMNYANRDEVRAAQYDTFSVVKAIRDEWERAFNDLAYAVDVLAERFDLTPAGERGRYQLNFDWDMSLIESTSETFSQNLELQAVGALSKAELRQWVRGGSLDEAEQAVQRIRTEQGQPSPGVLDDGGE